MSRSWQARYRGTWRNRLACAEMVGRPCWECGQPADSGDHYPSLFLFGSIEQWRAAGGELRPHCVRCRRRQAGKSSHAAVARRKPVNSRVW